MTNKITLEDIALVSKEVSESDALIEELNKKNDELANKRGRLLYDFILQNEMLKDSTWGIKSHGTALYYQTPDNNEGITLLKEMFGNGFANLLTQDGVELYYSDRSLTATFDSHLEMPEFVRKLKIKVDGSEVTARLRKINKEIGPLIELCHLFNLKG